MRAECAVVVSIVGGAPSPADTGACSVMSAVLPGAVSADAA
jgi:hypothetical protein